MAVLPPAATTVIFVKPQVVLQRGKLSFNIEDALSILSKRTDRILSEEMLTAAGIDKAAFAITEDHYGAAVLMGDFSGAIELLREAPETSDGLFMGRDETFDPPSVLAPHRGVEVFLFPYHDDLYISVPDEATILLAQSEQLHMEIVDRHLDGPALDESLARLLDMTGPIDFLVLRDIAAERGEPDPSSPSIYAGGGWLDAKESSSVFIFFEFTEAGAATQFAAGMEHWPLVQSYNSGEDQPIQEIRQEDQAIIALGVAPNIDLEGWLLGN